jgi:hypothetical protein
VWLKAFWGFDPKGEGYLRFTRPGDRGHFLAEARPGDLVLIYAADAKETAAEDPRQALGFLEIDPVPVSDRDRMSPEGLRTKIERGWQNRWTYAVPVRWAWRVKRPIEIKNIAPNAYTHNRASDRIKRRAYDRAGGCECTAASGYASKCVRRTPVATDSAERCSGHPAD